MVSILLADIFTKVSIRLSNRKKLSYWQRYAIVKLAFDPRRNHVRDIGSRTL